MEEIIITADYHTHTTYSHGTGSVEDNVKIAIEKGFDHIAITDHAKNHPFVGVKPKTFPVIREDIKNVQKKYPQIKILMGIEANLIGMSGAIDLSNEDMDKLDIVLVGFHLTSSQEKLSDYFKLVWNGCTNIVGIQTKAQIRRNTIAYVNMIKNNKIDILTHPGFRLGVDYKEIGKVCEDYGTYIELSTRHKTPNEKTIEDLLSTNVNFVIDSDAHKPEHVGYCDFALDLVKKYQISEKRIGNCNNKQLVLRSKN